MRLVCISDTHRRHRELVLSAGDILIHAGDIGVEYNFSVLTDLNKWLSDLPFKHKIVIPGNHDLQIEHNPLTARALMRGDGIHFLIDEEVVIDGVKFYGSPWQPWFHDWAWNAQRGEEIAQHWAKIPKDTDVLITHGPPYDVLDKVLRGGFPVGCEELAKKVIQIAPKVHVFGHIHEGYGTLDFGGIKFVNAACLNFLDPNLNQPIVVDI